MQQVRETLHSILLFNYVSRREERRVKHTLIQRRGCLTSKGSPLDMRHTLWIESKLFFCLPNPFYWIMNIICPERNLLKSMPHFQRYQKMQVVWAFVLRNAFGNYIVFHLPHKSEVRARNDVTFSWQLATSLVVVGTVSQCQLITTQYGIVSTTFVRADIAQHCHHDFLVTQKWDHVANEWCNVQLSLSLVEGRTHTELQTWGCRASSDFPN